MRTQYDHFNQILVNVVYHKVLVNIPLCVISQIEKIGGQARSSSRDLNAYGIEMHCKVRRKHELLLLIVVVILCFRIYDTSSLAIQENRINVGNYSFV
jgi:hypothetical protein